ncbi:FecR family protein [Terrimonas alba]|uniref:FecR family protein n=1 Tax=Terrimonas alba TaxID=3349636 RepID=UPI0035F3F765
MNGKEKFIELLQAYLSGKASSAAYNELMRMIKSGKYDDLLKQRIDDSLLHDNPTINLDVNRAQDLLYRILNSEKQTAKLIPVSKPVRRYRHWYAAAAALVIVTLAIWNLVATRNNPESPIAKTEKKILEPAPETNGKRYIRLQDGSTVLLNEGSQLDYPADFPKDKREVTLSGEAYFDIRPDAKRPFIVHTGKVNTTVLGTAFNIKAYPEQKQITVTVTRGKVKVGDNKKIFGVIVPNESIAVNTEINSFRLERVNADEALSWKKQYLVLDDISLEEAAVLIGNRYHVNISFSREELENCRISATFLNNENLEQVLTVVTGVVDADYTLQPNDEVIISGEGCE